MPLQTLTGGGGNDEGRDVFDESIKEEAFRKWSTFCFYFFLFSTFTICISTDLFFVSSHFVFLVLISQFVSDVLPSLLHTFFLIFHGFVQINDVP